MASLRLSLPPARGSKADETGLGAERHGQSTPTQNGMKGQQSDRAAMRVIREMETHLRDRELRSKRRARLWFGEARYVTPLAMEENAQKKSANIVTPATTVEGTTRK